jgi:[protein-PII] uridylyltransferase
VTRNLHLITSKIRRDPQATGTFLRLLAYGKRSYRTLTLMNDAGVLGRFIPEFGRVVAQMQFNMYHSYTVDEHTLRAVGVIGDMAAGRLVDDHPLAVSIMPLIEDREALFLAMLLHDTGKGGVGGQEKAGARSARSACERLGVERTKVELVAWLVENHLVMSDFAQKRDVADPSTVAAFARIVENPERLRLLLVITVADIRAVGPGVWNGWKGQLLRELYNATEAVFRGGRGSDAAASVQRHQEAAAEQARAALVQADPAAKGWAQAMEAAYFGAFSQDDLKSHAELARRAAIQGGAAAEGRVPVGANAAEIVIAAKDRRGLFADLALAISSLGGNVVGARVFTSRQGQALDVFHVQDVTGAALGCENPRALRRLADALEAAGRGEPVAVEPRRGAELSRTAAFSIAPTVVIDNEASNEATVVEASGRDRPGLLQALARTLADNGLSIQSAHIDGYGERAVDAFYVQTSEGGKVADAKKVTALKADLLAALEQNEAGAPNTRPGLKRARASVAR